jgi:hypothetical protein
VFFDNVDGVWLLNGGATSGHEDFFNGISSPGGELQPCWDDVSGWNGAQDHAIFNGSLYSEINVGVGVGYSDIYTGLKIGGGFSDTGLCTG